MFEHKYFMSAFGCLLLFSAHFTAVSQRKVMKNPLKGQINEVKNHFYSLIISKVFQRALLALGFQ
jgi:hypothetical protein